MLKLGIIVGGHFWASRPSGLYPISKSFTKSLIFKVGNLEKIAQLPFLRFEKGLEI